MSRLDPPFTFLDRSFLDALIDGDDPHHGEAQAVYAELVDDFEAERILLAVLDVDLAVVDPIRQHRWGLLAPAATWRVAKQHRDATERSEFADRDFALRTVIISWNRAKRIATFDPRWWSIDFPTVPAAPLRPTVEPPAPGDRSQQAGVAPAVDGKVGPGDEPGLVAAQEGDDRTEVLRTPDRP